VACGFLCLLEAACQTDVCVEFYLRPRGRDILVLPNSMKEGLDLPGGSPRCANGEWAGLIGARYSREH